jgi:putative phosphoribosyl transferase
MRAAAAALRQKQPAKIVVAVPVSAAPTCDEYRMGVDEIICAKIPEPFMGVGKWYRDFSQTTDAEVRDLLRLAEADVREHRLQQMSHMT